MISKNKHDLDKIEFAIKQLKNIDETKVSGPEHDAYYDILDMRDDMIKKLESKCTKLKKKQDTDKTIHLKIKNILEYHKNGYITLNDALIKIIEM